jgi:hypothetical protein
MHWIPLLGESPGGLFIGAVKGSDNNVQTPPLTTPFMLNAQLCGHYSHFILSFTYTRLSDCDTCPLLDGPSPVGPSVQDHHNTCEAYSLIASRRPPSCISLGHVELRECDSAWGGGLRHVGPPACIPSR